MFIGASAPRESGQVGTTGTRSPLARRVEVCAENPEMQIFCHFRHCRFQNTTRFRLCGYMECTAHVISHTKKFVVENEKREQQKDTSYFDDTRLNFQKSSKNPFPKRQTHRGSPWSVDIG
jgi:hypothetical protein